MLNPQTGLILSLLALPLFVACGAPNESEAAEPIARYLERRDP